MKWEFNDGGLQEAGYKSGSKDCTVRAIAIATGIKYETVLKDLWALNCNTKTKKRYPESCSPRDGQTGMKTVRKYMESIGWTWVPTMFIGSGCNVHLRDGELPDGRLVVRVSHHLTAVVNGVINDTHNCSRNEYRCVYGYFKKQETSK